MHARFLICVCCFLLAACLPSKADNITAKDIDIVQGEIAGNSYYIPRTYFVPPFVGVRDDSIYVRAMYPGFFPVPSDHNRLWKQGEWRNSVTILAHYYPHLPSATEFAKQTIKTQHAFERAGVEYGLLHQKQPPDSVQDHWDVWLEKQDDGYLSYITCSEQILENDVPQCTHNIFLNGFHIEANYDKRLLPYWDQIRRCVVSLFDSFHSKESAQEFLRNSINNSTHHNKK